MSRSKHCTVNIDRRLWGLNKDIPALLVAQLGKNLPAMQETQGQYLGWEDRLEKKMATRFRIVAWEIPLTQERRGLQTTGSQDPWGHESET